MDEASQAYENDSKYGQAVELLVSNKLFDKAIDVVCRYHIKVQVGGAHRIVNHPFSDRIYHNNITGYLLHAIFNKEHIACYNHMVTNYRNIVTKHCDSYQTSTKHPKQELRSALFGDF